MSFAIAVRLAIEGWRTPVAPPVDAVLPAIRRSAWATWAATPPGDPPARLEFGAVCVTHDGREGRVIEIEEERRTFLVCQPI